MPIAKNAGILVNNAEVKSMSRNDRRLTEVARALRKSPTAAEKILWRELRNSRMEGIKFRRQQQIGDYIVDFYASVPRLVIELDGDMHEGREAYDAARQQFLEEQGMRVVRFYNGDVKHNLRGVLESIYLACKANLNEG